jgi:hypothetical protein
LPASPERLGSHETVSLSPAAWASYPEAGPAGRGIDDAERQFLRDRSRDVRKVTPEFEALDQQVMKDQPPPPLEAALLPMRSIPSRSTL